MSKGSKPFGLPGGTFGNHGGMKKHARSGVAHNHANSIARTREYNKQLEAEKALREARKPKMYATVKEAFEN